MPMSDDILIRFMDGPMAGLGNIQSAAGSRDCIVSRETYGWPLPERLKVLTHPGVANVAIWDADNPKGSGLPEELLNSLNAVVYRKVSESRITDEVAAKMTHVIRGAAYELADSSAH